MEQQREENNEKVITENVFLMFFSWTEPANHSDYNVFTQELFMSVLSKRLSGGAEGAQTLVPQWPSENDQ